MSLNVLVIGSGGREHALCWKIAQSLLPQRLYVALGNPGTARVAKNVPIKPMEFDKLGDFCQRHEIHLVVIGPDDPLAAGLADYLRERGIKVFGPSKAAAEIEASKAFAKEVMSEANIPTASFRTFGNYREALDYLRTCALPVVIKANGPALGKGAHICRATAEAEDALHAVMVRGCHGAAGQTVVIEEFLTGQEISLHAFCDGERFHLCPPAQDHKAVGDGDVGPNTGGMGAIAPVPGISASKLRQLGDQIVKPTLRQLTQIGRPFIGCLYPGLMMAEDGPKVLEFNTRFGDPETQVLLPLLKSDLLRTLLECADGRLASRLEWYPGFACCVVLTSGGYPGPSQLGCPIFGLDKLNLMRDINVFQAGTAWQDGQLVTAGGRVLGITATGRTLEEAITLAYMAVGHISFQGMQYRHDIGAKSLQPLPLEYPLLK